MGKCFDLWSRPAPEGGAQLTIYYITSHKNWRLAEAVNIEKCALIDAHFTWTSIYFIYRGIFVTVKVRIVTGSLALTASVSWR